MLQQLHVLPREPTPDILDGLSREQIREMLRNRFCKEVLFFHFQIWQLVEILMGGRNGMIRRRLSGRSMMIGDLQKKSQMMTKL